MRNPRDEVPAAALLSDPGAPFAEQLRDQLQRMPWLGLSVLAHGLGIALLILLLPRNTVPAAPRLLAMEPAATLPPPPEPTPPPEEVVPQVAPEPQPEVAPVVQATEHEPDAAALDLGDRRGDTALAGNQHNPALGLGGGAGGPAGRRGAGRAALRKALPDTEKAIGAALGWLRAHQDEDGKWDADGFMRHDLQGAPCDGAGNPVHDVGVTGLALLAFLGDGHTLNRGEHSPAVRKACQWLREQQDPESGLLGSASSHDFVYGHAIATLALVEACGLSNSRVLRANAQRAIDYLQRHRNPYKAWRYQPRDGENDLSVTGWCVMALCSAQEFGLNVDPQALAGARVFVEEVTDPATGRAGYTRRGELSARHPGDHGRRFPPERGEALTAVGLFSRVLLGGRPEREPVMVAAANRILAAPPRWEDEAGRDLYAWYYASYALYQMGGRHWREWSRHLDGAVVKTQRRDGNFRGSHDPVDVWGEDGGRVYATALAALTLEAYYRKTSLLR